MASKSQLLPFLYLNLFLLILCQKTPSSSAKIDRRRPLRPVDDHFGNLHRLIPWNRPGPSKLSSSLNKAGYGGMSWFVENIIISTVLSVYGYNDTITIFAPEDRGFLSYSGHTKVLQPVVPPKLDRHPFKTNFSQDSTFPTFVQDFANPSFQFSDCIKVTQPLIDDAIGEGVGQKAKASIKNVSINDWEIYNDGRVIVHGVPRLFNDPWNELLTYYEDLDQDL